MSRCYNGILLPRPLSNDPRFIQCIYRYSRALKCFEKVYGTLRNSTMHPHTKLGSPTLNKHRQSYLNNIYLKMCFGRGHSRTETRGQGQGQVVLKRVRDTLRLHDSHTCTHAYIHAQNIFIPPLPTLA